ncbi:Protein F56F10.2 [Aphelenchoides avenae]|nr:Protein F56F10.2 [Aphelenchus avenae]
MISVTAAAHSFRRSSRPVGIHVKAYGSGRVALSAIPEAHIEPEHHHKSDLDCEPVCCEESCSFFLLASKLASKLYSALLGLLQLLFPFLFSFNHSTVGQDKGKQRSDNARLRRSSLESVEDKVFLKIFKHLDVRSLLAAESTCRRWRRIIAEKANELAKFEVDQIKLYFDEGEVICVPLASQKVPMRHAMPSVDVLSSCLRHMSTLSLFIRGLIQIETVPVLRRLSRLQMGVSQIYFLWCDFDAYAEECLTELFVANLCTLSDIGFEVCSPADEISDRLIEANLPHLVSFRVWSEALGNPYEITDRTMLQVADLFSRKQGCQLETIDLAKTRVTASGVAAVIEAWARNPRGHLSMSFHFCEVERADVVNLCQIRNIPLTPKGLCSRGCQLSLFIR